MPVYDGGVRVNAEIVLAISVVVGVLICMIVALTYAALTMEDEEKED